MTAVLKFRPDADVRDDGHEVLMAVREMVPALRDAQQECDELARPPAHIVEKLRAAGVYKLLIPKAFGGYGASMKLWMDVVTEIGRGNASIAWAVTLGASATWTFTSFFPEDVVRETLKAPDATFAGVFSGRVLESRPVDGGLHIDKGTWFFNSGVYEATHDLLGVTLFDDAGEPVGPGIALVPMEKIKKLDDWNPIGIRGSGSTNIQVEDLFIPSHHIVPLIGMMHGTQELTHSEPSARVPFAPALVSILTYPLLGAGEHMVENFLETLPKRDIKLTMYTKAAEAPVVHLALGEATGKIEAARLLIESGVQQMDDWANRGEVMPELQRAKVCRDAAFAQKLIWEGVDQLATISGGSFSWRGNIGNSIWSDIRVGTLHPLSSTLTNFEMYGRMLCGVEPPLMLV
ncbi:MAG: acyl-CoA dehydrogenase family protein [Sulfitobacter sp.]